MSRTLLFTLLVFTSMVFAQALPTDESTIFSGSGNCQLCHESDGILMMQNGTDISPVTQWRSTMMANSAKDPLWRAKIATELAAFPQHSALIQNRCTICHVPAGFTQANYDSIENYTLDMLDNDPLARDGVTCTACHQIQSDNLGTPESYSGHYEITDDRQIFGRYPNPLTGPMINFVGYEPVHSAHISSSELCATCHTLFTPSLDEGGNIIGEFPEQTPYIEWKNSFYSQEGGASCQECHMRTAESAHDISLIPPWHQELRQPFLQHLFVGANVTMLKLLRDHAERLGVTALAQHFDTTIAEAQRSLSHMSCTLDLSATLENDSTTLNVVITNLTGHKLPTGIPLRRMWLHVRAENASGTAIFESGEWDASGEIIGYDIPFEPHHDIITEPTQVQVYEAVMGDDQGQRTWTLLRAISHLKDNRLPPLGFTSSHASYDSIAIYGVPASDTNYNRVNGTEGSGSDKVTYRFPPASRIIVSVRFQTVQPLLVNYLASHDLPETNDFIEMYTTQSHEPLFMVSDTLQLSESSESGHAIPKAFRVLPAYPNPFNNNTVVPLELPLSQQVEITMYDIRGRRVLMAGRYFSAGHSEFEIDAAGLPSGVYMLQARAGSARHIQRVILLK